MQHLKDYIIKYIPTPEQIKKNKSLSYLKIFFKKPNLWYLNKYSISKGFAVGFFCAWLPIPFQMLVAAIASIIFSTNLPISVALVWITNPVTMPFLFAIAYKVGAYFLGIKNINFDIDFSFDFLSYIMSDVFPVILLGSTLIGTIGSIIGFFLIRLIWRFSVIKRWKIRKKKQNL